MVWKWYDPEFGRWTEWWTIDAQTGEPDGSTGVEVASRDCLGEKVIEDACLSADMIATKFTMKWFSDDELAALFHNRVLPPTFRGGPEDAVELLEHIKYLWLGAETCYQNALGRMPTEVERNWLYNHAHKLIRAHKYRA
jgi:hypothetical protein